MKPVTQWTTTEILEFVKSVDKKTWIKIGVGAAIALVVILFIIWPAWVTRIAVHQEIKSLQTQIMTTNTLYKKKPELIKNREDFMKYIQSAKVRLYQPGESSLLLGAISKMAVESKAVVIASKPTEYAEKFPAPFNNQYEGNAYDFSLEGGYHDLGTFISKIEANDKLLRVQSFSVRPQENSEKHLADVSLSAVSFKKGKS